MANAVKPNFALQGLYNFSPIRKAVDWAAKPVMKAGKEVIKPDGKTPLYNLDVLKKHLPGIVGMYISGFYILNTITSKGIPDENKMPLVINNIFCGVAATAGGYLAMPFVNGFSSKLSERVATVLKDKVAPEVVKGYQKGLSSMVGLAVFTVMFRYLAPVFATPVADKINKFLIKKGWVKDPAAAKKAKENQPAMNGNKVAAAPTNGANVNVVSAVGPANETFDSFLSTIQFKPRMFNA